MPGTHTRGRASDTSPQSFQLAPTWGPSQVDSLRAVGQEAADLTPFGPGTWQVRHLKEGLAVAQGCCHSYGFWADPVSLLVARLVAQFRGHVTLSDLSP